MDQAMIDLIAQADRLALQARAAAQAGDKKRAADLRRQFDLIYNQLEAQASGAIPAEIPAKAGQLQELGAVTNV